MAFSHLGKLLRITSLNLLLLKTQFFVEVGPVSRKKSRLREFGSDVPRPSANKLFSHAPRAFVSVIVGAMSWDGVHDLVRGLQAGDERGWALLDEMARAYLLRLAERILGPGWPGESVSDLMQKTWQRVLVGLEGFRGGGNDAQTGALLRAWLAQTMRNVYRNDRRYEGAQRRGQGAVAVSVEALAAGGSTGPGAAYQPMANDPSPSANAMAEERRLLVQQALEGLPDPMDRDIVRDKVFGGLSIGDIAARLNLSYDQVRKRFHDSLERLRPILQRLE